MTQINQQLAYLYRLERFEKIKPGLTVMTRLLKQLSNPHQKFPSIHIAGTNGKGSTAAMISNVLVAQGLKTGLYTSPHLVSFNERITVNHKAISDSGLITLIGQVKAASAYTRLNPTFFEFTTAVAFLYFARIKVDIAIIEVGMGGGLDATNVITPLLSIITNIDLDHTNWLGKTKSAIAQHKAGIIKKDTPVITADEDPKVISYLARICRLKNTKLYSVHACLNTRSTQQSLSRQTFHITQREKISSPPISHAIREIKLLSPNKDLRNKTLNMKYTIKLLGRHQVENAATSLLALHILEKSAGVQFNLHKTLRGLASTTLAGRLDILSHRPLVLLDGAHNESGINSLYSFLTTNKLPPLDTLLIGIKADKNPAPLIEKITPLFKKIIVTQAKYQPLPAHELASLIKKRHQNVTSIISPRQAYFSGNKELPPAGAMVVTGSLYLIGNILQAIKKLPHQEAVLTSP